jgi:hypothetical protein
MHEVFPDSAPQSCKSDFFHSRQRSFQALRIALLAIVISHAGKRKRGDSCAFWVILPRLAHAAAGSNDLNIHSALILHVASHPEVLESRQVDGNIR